MRKEVLADVDRIAIGFKLDWDSLHGGAGPGLGSLSWGDGGPLEQVFNQVEQETIRFGPLRADLVQIEGDPEHQPTAGASFRDQGLPVEF